MVTRMTDRQHRWKIAVDAQNSFGAMIRTECIVEATIAISSARARLVSCDQR